MFEKIDNKKLIYIGSVVAILLIIGAGIFIVVKSRQAEPSVGKTEVAEQKTLKEKTENINTAGEMSEEDIIKEVAQEEADYVIETKDSASSALEDLDDLVNSAGNSL